MPKKSPLDQTQFRVGDAMVHPERLVISINDEEHPIEPRIMEVLIALANAAQNKEILSAVDLYIRVWMGGPHARAGAQEPTKPGHEADNPVHKAITHLRKVFGDDPKSPRYIETIRKRGYRLVAHVVYQDHYRSVTAARKIWRQGSPFVGLNAFDSAHSGVFLGRSRSTSELVMAVRRQIDQQRRLVLVVGASGCGKTSLVNAGAIPMLTQDGGYGGLHALSVARCDLAGTRREDALPRLASALMQWSMDRRDVLPPQPIDVLAETLRRQPESLPSTLEDAFRRHANRDMSALTHPHLLLVIDHAEAIVADPSFGGEDHAEIDRFLHHLCESRYVCVIIIVRGDFYLALAEALPGMTERKSGDGHVDVLAPRTGEIGDIIRIPAASAGLEFQQHPESKDYLDDVLLRAAVAQPDALPLLQHTLQMLYERRSASMQLCFDAYQEIGGLEGALAHHAEEVFTGLQDGMQASLDQVLSRIVMMQPEDDRVSARRIARHMLDAPAIALAEAFVQARLFVAEHENGNAHYRVSHEALLRQWPRAADWIRENRRLLLARIRLQRAAARWVEEGRGDDHLLNPGAPLEEALDVRAHAEGTLSDAERDFILRSQRQLRRNHRVRQAAALALIGMAITSTAMAFVAMSMRDAAQLQETKSTNLTSFIIGEFSDRLDPTGNLALIENITTNTLRYCDDRAQRKATPEDLINCSRASRKLGEVMMERGLSNSALTLFMQSNSFSGLANKLAPHSVETTREYAQSAAWMGKHYQREGQLALALVSWSKYDEITREMRENSPLDPINVIEESYASTNLSTIERDLGLIENAQARMLYSIALKESAMSLLPGNDEWEYELIVSQSILTGLTSDIEPNRAIARYDEAISRLEILLARNPSSKEWERQLTSLLYFKSALLLEQNELDKAMETISKSIERLGVLTSRERQNLTWKRLLAAALVLASDIAKKNGEHESSIIYALAAAQTIHPFADSSRMLRRTHASALLRTGLGRLDASGADAMSSAIDTLAEMISISPGDRNTRIALAEALTLKANDLQAQGKHEESKADAARAIAVLEPIMRLKDRKALRIHHDAVYIAGGRASESDAWPKTASNGRR